MPNNLNQFKLWLKQPGAKLTLVKCYFTPTHKHLNKTRAIAKAQTNAVMLEGGSWLYFTQASDYQFNDNRVTVCENGTPELVYQLSN